LNAERETRPSGLDPSLDHGAALAIDFGELRDAFLASGGSLSEKALKAFAPHFSAMELIGLGWIEPDGHRSYRPVGRLAEAMNGTTDGGKQ